VMCGSGDGYRLQEMTTCTERRQSGSSQTWIEDALVMAPTPLSASAPAFRNCVGVGRVNEGRRRFRSGEEDGVRVNGGGGACGIDTGFAF